MQIVIDIPEMTLLNINSRELRLCSREDIEKLEFAIKNGTVLTECKDAISREDKKHIDGFKYWCETNEENGTITIPKFVCDEVIKILDKFSPVTPRTNCQYRHENGNCLKVGGFCTSVDDKHCSLFCEDTDTISRESVLNKIKEICFSKEWVKFRCNYGFKGQIEAIVNYVECLSSVTPSRRKGHWIGTYTDNGWRYECSVCGRIEPFNNEPYCHCGAKMENTE